MEEVISQMSRFTAIYYRDWTYKMFMSISSCQKHFFLLHFLLSSNWKIYIHSYYTFFFWKISMFDVYIILIQIIYFYSCNPTSSTPNVHLLKASKPGPYLQLLQLITSSSSLPAAHLNKSVARWRCRLWTSIIYPVLKSYCVFIRIFSVLVQNCLLISYSW